MKKTLYTLTIALTLLLVLPSHAQASLEFLTDYRSLYSLDSSGYAEVEHQITITNNLANIYTTNYTISVGSNSLKNIKVSDELSALETNIKSSKNSTTIDAFIDNPSIGKDQAKNLTISYTNPDIAQQNGNIWEINIPKLAQANEINNYVRILEVPANFPKPSITTPTPSSISATTKLTTYTFQGHESESITMFFGEYQLYALNLKYTINNPGFNNTLTEIAIPPDTNYQRIFIENLDPKPLEIKLDEDYNWLAIYDLEPQQELNIDLTLVAQVFATPVFNLPSNNPENLTQSQPYWELDSPDIALLATQLATPKNIYNYLVENYVYSYERLLSDTQRFGAKKALANPNVALCMEFTDSFIALARSLDIPAREVNGFAYTNNKYLRPLSLSVDILHAWPEYYDYDSGNWIQIDPTWANTTGGIDYFNKLDFNHITFVRHGLESDYPHPAGTYKNSPVDKYIDVQITEIEPLERIEIDTTILIDSSSTFQNHRKLVITNLSNVSLINYELTIDYGQDVVIEYLPPYATQEIILDSSLSFNLPSNIIKLIIFMTFPIIAFIIITVKYKHMLRH